MNAQPGYCCPGLDYVQQGMKRIAHEHDINRISIDRMGNRFEEELGSLREAIELETTRRREDMKELTRALNELQNAISLQYTGVQGPRGPTGPTGPTGPKGVFDTPLSLQLLAVLILGFLLNAIGHDALIWIWHLIRTH